MIFFLAITHDKAVRKVGLGEPRGFIRALNSHPKF